MQTLRGKLAVNQPATLLLWLVLSVAAVADDETGYDPFAAAEQLKETHEKLTAEEIDQQFLAQARAEAITEQTRAEACEAAAAEDRARLDDRIKPFKNIDGDVDPTVFNEYLDIRRRLDDSIRRQTQCGTIVDAARDLISLITSIQNDISQQFLSSRNESILGAIRNAPRRIAAAPQAIRNSVSLDLLEGISPLLLFWVLVGGGILAALLGVFIQHRFCRHYLAAGGDAAKPQFRLLFPKPLAEHAPLMLEGLTLTAILFATIDNASESLMIVRLAAAFGMYGIGCVVIDWATGPLSPSASVKGLVPDHVNPLRRRLRIFNLTLVASFVVLGTNWLAIRTVALEVVGRATMIFVVAAALLFVLAYLGRIPGMVGRFRLIRYSGTLALLVGIGALLLGFHNFAGYVVHGVTRTVLALFLLWVLLWSIYTLFDFLLNQDTEAANQIRKNLGMTDKATRTGFGFMQLAIDLVVWVTFVVFIIYVWDDSGTTLDSLYERIVNGVSIGELKLVPIKIIGAILLFIALLIVIGWIKRWIDRRWLQQIVIERGAREALVTIFGYIGFVVAVIIGLTQAGVDLTGLAWVTGGLAIGLGFGMQEIANNFVSGLILLFERPIRTGDFVSVGDTEGFVRNISIRATEIETMDNQNVLVPNSELISGRVTNWVLRDSAGRLQIQVGVAYGSAVEKVRDILEAVSREHPEVILDGSAPAPRALFMGFGDSSLDFELRVRIFRIARRFSVASDLNFLIDAAFREEGVTIPFPQRDLHVISYPPDAQESKAEKAKEVPQARRKDDFTSTRLPSPSDNITRTHKEHVDLDAEPKDAWAAITDIEILKKWLAKDGEFAAHIGGAFELELRDGTDMSGRIDIYIPKRRMRLVVALRQGAEPLPTGPITVTLQLKEIEKGTTLTVTVAGIPADEDWEEDYKRSEVRWQTALEELKAVINDTA
jgi:potassium-dependent mechanosensitive channel